MKILAICGSTRTNSSNLKLIQAIAQLSKDHFETEIYTDIDKLPHFNPDIELSGLPESVQILHSKIKQADGILICTPEYAMGVPGTLKNAIDWCVGSIVFSKKPTALITASSLGEKGHLALLETLKVIEADIDNDSALVISYIASKVNDTHTITDAAALASVIRVVHSLNKKMEFSLSMEA